MSPAIIVAVVAAASSGLAAYLAFRSSKAANKTTDRRVDLEELRELRERYRQTIEDLGKELDRSRSAMDLLRSQMDRVHDQLAKEMDVSNALRNQIRVLEDRISDLSRSRDSLQRRLNEIESRGITP